MTTTANMTHSPLPWTYTPHASVFDVLDSNGHYVCISASEQDAQLICTAVNSHQALVGALKGCESWISTVIAGSDCKNLKFSESIRDNARAALALATGGNK